MGMTQISHTVQPLTGLCRECLVYMPHCREYTQQHDYQIGAEPESKLEAEAALVWCTSGSMETVCD